MSVTEAVGFSQRRKAVEVPKLMRTRPRDPRGYPIPFIVLMDRSGKPQFTINDHRRVMKCHTARLCSICGRPHQRDAFWFIGGSRCFLHEHGAFLDPPVHYECGEYALRVCPFLAAQSYTKRIDDRKLRPEDKPANTTLVMEEFMQPSLPECFGFGRALGYRREVSASHPGGIYVVDDWRYVEWWKGGEPINAPATGQPPRDEPLNERKVLP